MCFLSQILIKGGEIVNAEGSYNADVYVEDGIIRYVHTVTHINPLILTSAKRRQTILMKYCRQKHR